LEKDTRRLWDYIATVVASVPGEVFPLRADAYG
jgi:hypothetical protein